MVGKIKKRLMKFIAKSLPTGHRIRRKCLKMAGYEIGEQVYIGEDVIIIDEPDDTGRVKIGDRVIYGTYAGFERMEDEGGDITTKDKGIEYMYCHLNDLCGIFERKTNGKG